MTPADCMDSILKMGRTDPYVHQALTLQAVYGLSTEDMLVVLAYQLLRANAALTRDNINLLQRLPPQI